MEKFCLVISGSDPTCGAGLQLDIQVLLKIGVRPLSVISAITAQTADTVKNVWHLTESCFEEQLNSVNHHYEFEFCKVGMVTESSVKVLKKIIGEGNFAPKIILDPVLASSSGFEFVDKNVLSMLFEHAYLVTPNINEMEALLDIRIRTQSDMESSVKQFQNKFHTKNVLIKGGHLEGHENIDILLNEGKVVYIESKKIENSWQTHGTGCYLSSAIAGFLCKGFILQDAILQAKKLLAKDLEASSPLVQDRAAIFKTFSS